jgi:PKD repeat protein
MKTKRPHVAQIGTSAANGIGATWQVYLYDAPAPGETQGQLRAYDRVENMWATEGRNAVLDALRLTSITSASAIGLINSASFSARNVSDTLAAHAGWLEFTGYVGSRKVPAWSPASGRTIAATGVVFKINANATLRGAFLALGLAGTADRLGSMSTLDAPFAVTAGQVLIIDIAVTMAAPSGVESMLTNTGAAHWLDRVFRSSGAVPALRMGFLSPSPTLASTDAFGSHAGWTEATGYAGATRPAVSHAAASAAAMAQSGSASVTPSVNGTFGGCFLTTNSTKGDEGSGVLVMTRRFATNQAVTSGTPVSVSDAAISLGNYLRPPVAGFTGAPLAGVVPFDVVLTDTSTRSPTAWSWSATNGTTTLTSSAQNPTLTLTQAGSWSITLIATNDEGASIPFTRTAYVLADNPTTFTAIGIGRSTASGSQWVLGGLSTAINQIMPVRRAKLWGRYPVGAGGTLFKLQVDNECLRAGGTPRLSSLTGLLPAGYVTGESIEVGYSDTLSAPATPDWTTITATNPQFDGTISIYKLPVYWWQIGGAVPIVGDTLAFTINGTTYSRTYESAAQISGGARENLTGVLAEIVRDITQDPTGAARCYANSFARLPPPPAQGSFSTANDLFFAKQSTNSSFQGSLGWVGGNGGGTIEMRPADWSGSAIDTGGAGGGNACTYIWGRKPAAGVDPANLTITCQITRAGGSTFGWRNDKADAAQSLTSSAALYQVQAAAPRVAWSWNWTDAAGVLAYGATRFWRNGTECREVIKRLPLRRVSDNAIHPSIEIRARVTFAKDGTVLHREIDVENCKGGVGARDIHYDVTAINVAGTNQIAGELARYSDLLHIPGAKWEWSAAEPVMIMDPVMAMDAGNVPTWNRAPARNPQSAFWVKTRGADAAGDLLVVDGARLTQRGGYERAQGGDPLYAGNIKFDGQGGGAGEIGSRTYWSWAFWSGDVLALWPRLVELAGNAWSAWPFHFVDDQSAEGADWIDAPPSLYMRPGLGLFQGFAPDRFNFGKKLFPDGVSPPHDLAASPEQFSLWSGSITGSYGARYSPVTSHAPPHAALEAYIAVPKERYARSVEMYSWSAMTGLYGCLHGKATAGVNGDANHRVTGSNANGIRSFAWPFRHAVHVAGILPDWHPRRTYWRRVVGDFAVAFDRNVSNSTMGFYLGRVVQLNSDNFNSITSQLPGDIIDGWFAGSDVPGFVDTFKEYYITLTVAEALDMEVADMAAAMTKHRAPLLLLDRDLTSDRRWEFLGTFGINLCDTSGNPGTFKSPNGVILGTLAQMIAEIDAKSSRNVGYAGLWGDGSSFGRYLSALYSSTPFPDLRDPASPGQDGLHWTYTPNYPKPGFHRSALLGFARYTTNSVDRAKANAILAKLAEDFPATTVITAGYPYAGMTYEELWGTWGMIQRGSPNTRWT